MKTFLEFLGEEKTCGGSKAVASLKDERTDIAPKSTTIEAVAKKSDSARFHTHA
jgi:hypothetical protein